MRFDAFPSLQGNALCVWMFKKKSNNNNKSESIMKHAKR